MIFINRNPVVGLISIGVSLLIFGIVYFTVIKPSTDTANNAVKQGLTQAGQALKQSGADKTAAGRQAERLTACVAAAGTDAGKIESCRVKFAQ